MSQFSKMMIGGKAEAASQIGIYNPEASSAVQPAKPDAEPAAKEKAKSKTRQTPDFPLWQRQDGRWCRKIKSTVHYFGKDKEAALEEWERTKSDLLAGRTPRVKTDGLLLGDLCERFLNVKRALVQSRELSQLTFGDYLQTCNRLVATFGKNRVVEDLGADDFEAFRASLAKTRGLVGIGNVVRLSRIVFKYAIDVPLIDRPVRFGPSFKVPTRKNIRKAKAGKPAKIFTADEIRKQIAEADDVLACMILLAVNCGFGQTDVANLPVPAIDLKTGWIEFPRVKTGSDRRIPIWPETIKAIRAAMKLRPAHKNPDDADLLFVTRCGNKWTRTTEKGAIDSIRLEFDKVLATLAQKKKGVGFYALRHVFETISGAACDQIATNAVMGHIPQGDAVPSMYREHVADERLLKVTNHVRAWLFPAKRRAR